MISFPQEYQVVDMWLIYVLRDSDELIYTQMLVYFYVCFFVVLGCLTCLKIVVAISL